jgi:hypothetical protein
MIANWPSKNSKVIAQIRGSPVTELCNNGFVLRKRINYVDGFDVGHPQIVFKFPAGSTESFLRRGSTKLSSSRDFLIDELPDR